MPRIANVDHLLDARGPSSAGSFKPATWPSVETLLRTRPNDTHISVLQADRWRALKVGADVDVFLTSAVSTKLTVSPFALQKSFTVPLAHDSTLKEEAIKGPSTQA